SLGFGSPAPLPDGRIACISHEGIVISGPGFAEATALRSDVAPFDLAPCSKDHLLMSSLGGAIGLLELATGHVLLIHREPGTRLHSPILLAPRPRPPILPSELERTSEDPDSTGYLLCTDIRQGRQGAIDRERVVAVRIFAGEPFALRSARHPYGHIGTEGIELGTAPVASDGSFWVRVPADRALAIQAVDADGRSVVNSLSWLYVRPNETRSCTGCHALRDQAPESRPVLAMRAPPVDLTGGAGPHRFRANNAANGGGLNLQLDPLREAASIDLLSTVRVREGDDRRDTPPARKHELDRLQGMIRDGSVEARVSAARRLAILRDRSAAPSLARALDDESGDVRLAAALALASSG